MGGMSWGLTETQFRWCCDSSRRAGLLALWVGCGVAACAQGAPRVGYIPSVQLLCSGDSRTVYSIQNGTDSPTLPLTRAQQSAICWLQRSDNISCSCSLITPQWVLTAKHCTQATDDKNSFSDDLSRVSYTVTVTPPVNILSQSTAASYSETVSRIVLHPTKKNDLTLMQLQRPITTQYPSVQPLGLSKEDAYEGFKSEPGWKQLEAAGFGKTSPDGDLSGTRKFAYLTTWNVAKDPNLITTWGEAETKNHGVCKGDSGGPLMHMDSDGVVRIAGVLFKSELILAGTTEKSVPCNLTDNFTRVDVAAHDSVGMPTQEWIEKIIGGPAGVWRSCAAPGESPTPATGGASLLSPVQRYGSCLGKSTLLRCNGQDVASTTCASDKVCGWKVGANRYDCINPSDDPCQGVTLQGGCQGTSAVWCEYDARLGKPVQKRRDCASCNRLCAYSSAVEGFDCVDPAAAQNSIVPPDDSALTTTSTDKSYRYPR